MSIYDQFNRGSSLTDKAYALIVQNRFALLIGLAVILLIINPIMIFPLVIIALVWEIIIRKS